MSGDERDELPRGLPPESGAGQGIAGSWIREPLVLQREAELDELVRIVALRGDLQLQAGAPGSGWWFQPRSALINADAQDLIQRQGDYVRGLAIHEAAHAAITRYQDIVPRDALRMRWLQLLLNVVEDCRIEEWMQLRLPGCEPWVRSYNDRIFGRARSAPRAKSALARFCLGVLCRWWYGQHPSDLGDEVQDALERTWPALRRAIGLQPPATRLLLPAVRAHYWRSPVCRAFVATDGLHPPDDWEALVRLAQYGCWATLYQDVLPILEPLLDQDRRKEHEARKAVEEMFRQLRGHEGPPPESAQQGRRRGAPGWTGPGGGPDTREEIEKALDVDPDDRYLATWKRVAPLVDELAEALLRILEKVGRTRWISGYASGARLDPRIAMQMEADPRHYVQLWQRKSLPRRVDPAFILLLDRSGSMEGDRMEHAFEGLVLLVEVCKRLGIPTEIWSFASNHRQERSWDEGLGADTRNQLGRLPQRCSGGTVMHEALHALGRRLPELPHRDRVLIVLGDGQPSDHRATRRAVSDLTAEGVACVGLGIGSGTREMRSLFGSGLFGVPVERVARSLALIIRQALGVSDAPAGKRAARG